MQPLVMSHYTVVSALGRGLAAHLAALRERRCGLRPCDFEDAALATYIGRVEGLESCAIGAAARPEFDCRNNRLALLTLQQDGYRDAVAAARRQYGADRIAVIMGTSTSGILETEHAYQRRDPDTGALPPAFGERYPYTHNTFSLGHFVRSVLGLHGPALVVSTACSSSAKVFATAARFIASGYCDAAVVGGVDTLCLTTLYGFTSLELTSTAACRPCDAERDGLSLGEAGAFLLLEKRDQSQAKNAPMLLGYGESCDGYHMSHPHPEGYGAVSAMRAALRSAGCTPTDIDYINLHGTATRANDRVEDLAVSAVFGTRVPCSSTKGWTGHTLGAAGATEAVLSLLCLQEGLIPGTLNTRRVDPALKSRIVLANEDGPLRRILSNIFGFGGNNCSLVFGHA